MNAEQLSALNSSLRLLRVSSNYGKRKSIAKLSKNAIIQHPIIISSSIDNEDIMTISKNLEKQVAVMLVAYFSTNNVVDTNKYESVGDYLSTFTNTSLMPYKAGDIHSSLANPDSDKSTESYTADELNDIIYEGAKMEKLTFSNVPNNMLPNNYAIESLRDPSNEINSKTVNDLYKPFNATIYKLQSAHNAMEAIARTTADSKTLSDLVNMHANPHLKRDSEENGSVPNDPAGKHGPRTFGFDDTNKMPSNLSDKRNFKPVEYFREYATLAPTMVECEFILTNKEKVFATSSSYMRMHTVFGVKAVTRLVPSDVMVSNVVGGLTNRGIFKFIKWTQGELGFIKDIILGTADAKRDALKSRSNSKVFSNLNRLKRTSAISNAFGRNIPATTIMIISNYEAEQIMQTTGVDLRDPIEARKFIYGQFLLGFGIFNTETGMLQFMFDSDDDFAVSSLTTMSAQNKKSDVSVNKLSDALKLLSNNF